VEYVFLFLRDKIHLFDCSLKHSSLSPQSFVIPNNIYLSYKLSGNCFIISNDQTYESLEKVIEALKIDNIPSGFKHYDMNYAIHKVKHYICFQCNNSFICVDSLN